MKTIGVALRSGCARIASASWMPSISGMETSVNTASGCTRSTRARPSRPFMAKCSSCFVVRSAVCTSLRIIGSSSTNTTFPIPTGSSLYRLTARRKRKQDVEYRTATELALSPGAAAVHLHDLPHDRQPQSRPLYPTHLLGLHAAVLLPDRFDRVCGDAHPVVFDAEMHAAVVRRGADEDRAAGGRVLHRIRQQVRYDLRQ